MFYEQRANGARDEPHPQGADAPQAQTRRSGARRSRVASAASDVGSIEQLGGRDVAHRDRPEGLQHEDLLNQPALTAQWNLAPIRTDASAASVRPNVSALEPRSRALGPL